MKERNWKYKITGNWFGPMVIAITTAVSGGFTFWLYTAHDGAFVGLGGLTAFFAIICVLSAYGAMSFKLLVDIHSFMLLRLLFLVLCQILFRFFALKDTRRCACPFLIKTTSTVYSRPAQRLAATDRFAKNTRSTLPCPMKCRQNYRYNNTPAPRSRADLPHRLTARLRMRYCSVFFVPA